MRQRIGATDRLAWEKLFFDKTFGGPLSSQATGAFATPLEMVRLGPSASNKQPWRIIRRAGRWDFYLQRTKGYGKGTLAFRLLGLADLQRVDMGIAMCHFELASRHLDLKGRWAVRGPEIEQPGEATEYTISWETAAGGSHDSD